MKAIHYIGCVVCGKPRDNDTVPDDPRIAPHEHQWTEMQLVAGWDEPAEEAA